MTDRAERPGRAGRPGAALVLLLLGTVAVHSAVHLSRPAVSYRVLAFGGEGTEVGLIAASSAVLPVFLALPMGRLADRGRTLAILLGGGLLIVAGTALLGSAASLPLMAAGNAVLGTGHLATMVGFQGLVAFLSPPARQDRNFGLFTAAASAGQLIGPLLGGKVIDATASGLAAATTRALLVASAFGALVLLCSAGLALLARRPGAPRRERPSGSAARGRAPARHLLANRRLLVAMFTSFTFMSSVDVLAAYLPVLGEQRGVSPGTVGVLLAVRAASSFASRLLIPLILRGFGRMTVLVSSSTAAAVGVVALTAVHPVWLLGVLMGLVGFVLGLGQPLTMTWVVREAPEHLRATALALRLTGNRIAQGIAPLSAAAMSVAIGAAGPFWLIGGLLAAAGVTVLPLARHRRVS